MLSTQEGHSSFDEFYEGVWSPCNWECSCWPVCEGGKLGRWEPKMGRKLARRGCMLRVLTQPRAPFPRTPCVWWVLVAGRGEAGKEGKGPSSGCTECWL